MKPKVISFILILFAQVAFAQTDSYKNVYTESAWKERDGWQKADEIIRKMSIDKNSVVADIGCHEGYMSFKLVNVAKHVYAVDVEQPKLDKINKHKPANLTTVKGDYDNPKLPENALDAVVILDTYHEMDDHDKILEHVKASLKSGGRLVICEPIADGRRNLARADQEKRHELGMKFALEDLAKAGFTVIEKIDPFVDREKIKGDKMWIIVAQKT
ncbi:MAG TPA: class I SAM-dependent methyltransferase [Cyclobacteriaceae bacterium]|nr:class I SAM-dependent methyltransferase [Cyclobacteriaceae bacterium]